MAPTIKVFVFMKKLADVAAYDGSNVPARLTVCEAFADASGGPPVYEGVTIGWFDNLDGARRFADAYADTDAIDVVIADELILRGHEYLEERWTRHAGEERVKMM